MSKLTITQVLPTPNSVTVDETSTSTSVIVQQSFNNTTVVVNPLNVTNYYGGGGEVSAALTGVPSLSTDLGTFAPGTTISDNTTIYGALNELDTNVTSQGSAISTLQSDVAGNASDISNNATDISNNTSSISTNTGNIATNAGDISVLQGDLAQEITDRAAGDSTLQQQINTNISNISSNDTDIANNATDISTNTSAINTLDSQVVKKTDSIDALNDVDTVSIAPLDGEVLKWNGLNWVPGPGGGVVRVEVKNDTATDFNKGEAVYVSGTHASGKPTVELADNNGTATYPAIGLLEDDLIAGAEGFVVVSGSIFNLDTIGYAAGDALYIDSTPGALVNTRPDGATTKVQKVALVKKSHATSGSVIVMGAGRTNDVPNIGNGNFWLGNTNGVAQEQGFDSFVGQTTQVQANLTNIGINAANISSNTTSINTNASSILTNSAAITGKVTKTGDTMSGFLNLHANPVSNLHAATKQYVDTIAAAGLHYHEPVRLEAPTLLSANYNNGTNGVGATLTSQVNFPPFSQLNIDGVLVNLGDRILVYNQFNQAHNGIYTVTDQGFNQPWELTRATDADSYAPSDPNSLGQGDAFFVKEGNTGAGELYVMNTQGAITFGTTAIQFTQVAATAVYSAGNGLLLTGTSFSVDSSIQRKPAEGAFVDGDKTKLDGIASGANVNVNADWNAIIGDALILNKPTLGTAAAANVSDFIENDSSIAAQPIRQYYADTSAFPSASTWHGAIAHSHADGAMYFAHGGAWLKLGNDSDIFDGDYNSLTNQPTIPVVNADAQAYDANLTTFVNNFTLPTVDGSSGHVLTTNGSGTLSFAASGGSGSSTLLGLTDTPATFGSTGQVLAVNSAGTAVEFVTPSGGTGSGSQRTLTAGANNNDWEGDIVTFGTMTPGNSFTAGKLYVWKGGFWEEAYAVNTTASIGMLAIATDSSTTKMLTRGTFTSSSMTSFTTANTLYVSANQAGSGRMMDTVPGSPASGTVIRVCGYVINGTNGQVFFDPSKDYITIA